jgi:hypothetical protein
MKSKLNKRIKRALSSLGEDGDYWKWKILPSPIKLGMSDNNALGSRHFGNQTGQATWEDWEEKVKEMYPVRFFLVEELIPWLRQQWRRQVTSRWYWFVSHVVPSRRYHMLDLRQPKPGYRYGWLDLDSKITYALFNILNNFVEREMPFWYCPSEEEVQQEPHLIYQRSNWLEAKAIHYWWNTERPRQQAAHDKLLHDWSEARKVKAPEAQQLWDDMRKAESALEAKEEEMIIRLIKIRRSLWT